MGHVHTRPSEADRLRRIEDDIRKEKIRRCTQPGAREVNALAQEHAFAQSRWARARGVATAALGSAVSVLFLAATGSWELVARAPVAAAVIGGTAWFCHPLVDRAARKLFWRTRNQ